jgi:hypothetical protein
MAQYAWQASWVMVQVTRREAQGKRRCVAATSLCYLWCNVGYTFLLFFQLPFQLPNLDSGGQSTMCLGLKNVLNMLHACQQQTWVWHAIRSHCEEVSMQAGLHNLLIVHTTSKCSLYAMLLGAHAILQRQPKV